LVHSGSGTDSGHYYCYLKKDFKFWVVCNDENVKETDKKKVFENKKGIFFDDFINN
jgi:uncharacterized UBP type Zn finger protein